MRIDLGDGNDRPSALRDALLLIQFLEEKDEKAKAKEKEKDKGKKPSGQGGDLIGNVMLLTLLQFGIGPLAVWFWTYMFLQSKENILMLIK